LEKPLELAAYLMQGTPLDSVQVLSSEISKGYTQKFVTPSYLAIYIVYITAWVDYEGIINFRPDIYELDSPSSDHSCKDMEILP
jgi:murein L,D-transpeptidase YcbB/YkuD